MTGYMSESRRPPISTASASTTLLMSRVVLESLNKYKIRSFLRYLLILENNILLINTGQVNGMIYTLTRPLRRKAKSSKDRVTLEKRPRISSAEVRKLIWLRASSSSRWTLSAIRRELKTSFSVC